MASEIIDISIWGLLIAYGLFAAVAALAQHKRMGIARDMAWSAVRMTIQLVAAGAILEYVFEVRTWYLVLAILVYFLLMSSRIVLGRVKYHSPTLQRNIVVAIGLGAGSVLAAFLLLVTSEGTVLDPRYAIPLGGMIFGGAMNGCALAYERFHSSVQKEQRRIETLLGMGATFREASAPMVRESVKAAFLPQILAMSAMGIVMLPGMMTGQILSGTMPFVAIRYQIAIMLALVSSNAAVAYAILHLESRQVFNDRHQFLADKYQKSYKTRGKT